MAQEEPDSSDIEQPERQLFAEDRYLIEEIKRIKNALAVEVRENHRLKNALETTMLDFQSKCLASGHMAWATAAEAIFDILQPSKENRNG